MISDIAVHLTSAGNSFQVVAGDNGDVDDYPYGKLADGLLLDSIDWDTTVSADTGVFINFGANWQHRGSEVEGMWLWRCTQDAGSAESSTVFTGSVEWGGITGCYAEGGDGSALLDHYYYLNFYAHGAYVMNGSGTATSMNYNVNWNVDNTPDVPRARDFNIDGSDFSGTERGLDHSNNNNVQTAGAGYFDDVVVQKCRFHCVNEAAHFYSVDNIAFRDCNFWGHDGGLGHIYDGHLAGALLYEPVYQIERCKFHGPEEALEFISDDGLFRENGVHSTSTEAAIAWDASEVDEGTWDVGGNTLYAPSSSTDIALETDAGDGETISEWNTTFSAAPSDTEADPGWNDPANGDFD